MKLTPITVPGKRRRAGESAPSRISRRSRKAPAERLLSKVSKRTRRHKVSYLEERLPLEILRDIFIYSGNISFVHASPLIGKFLSAMETRHEIFIGAFAPTWCTNAMPDYDADYDASPDFQVRFIANLFSSSFRGNP